MPKILKFYAENIHKLKIVEIRPDGPIVQLTGANAQGKTSVLDAISLALEGTEGAGTHILRRGTSSGGVLLEIGDDQGELLYTVKRSFADDGKTTLNIIGADRQRYPTPQALLNGLLGKLGFDPLAFMRMKPRDQMDQLRALVKLEGFDPEKLDYDNKVDYDARTEAKRKAKGVAMQIEAIPVPLPDLPKEPVDLSKIAQQMETAGVRNTAIEAQKSQVATWRQNSQSAQQSAKVQFDRVEEFKKQIAESIQRAEELIKEAQEWDEKADAVKIPEPVDTSKLTEDFRNAQATNAQITKRDQRLELEREKLELETRAEELTLAMANREAAKAEAIAKAKLPVDGLSFSGGEVMFNEVPLAQASSAEQLRVSVAIAMATNPKLRLIRISDGSLLDPKSLDLIAAMADKGNYQIWIETVDVSGTVGIVMEDGEVASVHPPATAKNLAPKKGAKKAVSA